MATSRSPEFRAAKKAGYGARLERFSCGETGRKHRITGKPLKDKTVPKNRYWVTLENDTKVGIGPYPDIRVACQAMIAVFQDKTPPPVMPGKFTKPKVLRHAVALGNPIVMGAETPEKEGKAPMRTVGLGLHWDELEVGEKFRTINRTVTEADLVNFINACGMVEMIFTDTTYAGQGAISGGRPVPGALCYTFAEGLLVQSTMQHTGLAMLETELKVLAPTNVGDTIHVEVEVLSVRPTSKGNRGIVTTRNDVVNDRGETVVSYRAVRMMKGRGN